MFHMSTCRSAFSTYPIPDSLFRTSKVKEEPTWGRSVETHKSSSLREGVGLEKLKYASRIKYPY